MTADSRQLGADAHREGVRVQQEHGEALRGGRRLLERGHGNANKEGSVMKI